MFNICLIIFPNLLLQNDLSHQNPMPIVYDFTVLRDNPESKDVSVVHAIDVAKSSSYVVWLYKFCFVEQ